ncbi:MAG: YibE/F family protein [Candidatus Spechtbacterales bacterium]
MKRVYKFVLVSVFCAFLLTPFFTFAQHMHDANITTLRAVVLRVVEENTREVEGTGVMSTYQIIEARILEGEREGETISLEDDFIRLKEGDKFFLNILQLDDGSEIYSIGDFDRRGVMLLFFAIFVVAVIALGKWEGVRALISLGGAFLVILYILVPGILGGRNPAVVSALVAIVVLVFVIYFTHGLNRRSHAALLGAVSSVIFTVFLAYVAVDMGHLSGFTDEAASFLNIQTKGEINFSGLLLGAMIIGILGLLDDIAITQASAVEELYSVAPDISEREVFTRALRVGRGHVSALVNTLALAYTGTSLALLLLFFRVPTSIDMLINREIFATEILRIIVGSIGIILTVPITTLLAVWFLRNKDIKNYEK